MPDFDQMSADSHKYYDNNLRGGEAYMEVGKVMSNVIHNKVNMTISVKPFGCMPSSGVSDGVQSLITEKFPQAIFLPIETTGDGAVNVYSRIQMQLFKAKQRAKSETESELEKHGLTREEIQKQKNKRFEFCHALYKPPHAAGCTSADVIAKIGNRFALRTRNKISKNTVQS